MDNILVAESWRTMKREISMTTSCTMKYGSIKLPFLSKKFLPEWFVQILISWLNVDKKHSYVISIFAFICNLHQFEFNNKQKSDCSRIREDIIERNNNFFLSNYFLFELKRNVTNDVSCALTSSEHDVNTKWRKKYISLLAKQGSQNQF